MRFQNRTEAGQKLAHALEPWRASHPVVIALPRGGVPVAVEVARLLGAPMDVLVVRKLGAPMNPEYAVGALAEGGKPTWRAEATDRELISAAEQEAVVARESAELQRRVALYRGGRPPVEVKGGTVLVVDDGLATGATMVAAVRALRGRGAAQIVVAVPVAATSSAVRLRREADAVVALVEEEAFFAIGEWYSDFGQVPDAEVLRLLAANRPDPGTVAPRTRPVEIADGDRVLPGLLAEPAGCRGWVVFAHGSGSSHTSPRNAEVARVLNDAGLGTLLFDLLTPREAEDRRNVFAVPLLVERLLLATRWLRKRDRGLPIGYFGASTGAAAALGAAAHPHNPVYAVVSRGGRPDLASPYLARVRAPVLLIVGSLDTEVLSLNELAAREMPVCQVEVVPGASHLFEEPGTLQQTARLASEWFVRHLPGTHHAAAAGK